MRRFFARSANLVRRDSAEREMSREIESHLSLIAEDFEREGMTPEEARIAARRKYGGVEQAKEMHREARSFLWIEELLRDIRYGMRNLLRTPGFTITAVAALTLGIGANTAIFSVVNAILLKPLPVPDPGRLVALITTAPGNGEQAQTNPEASPAKFAFWRTQSSVLEDVTALTDGESVMNYSGGDVLEQWSSMSVSRDFFRMVGSSMLRGRSFSAEEEKPGARAVAVIGHSLWVRRFGSDPAVAGKAVSLNGTSYTIIGVAEDSEAMREFGSPTDVYIPRQVAPNTAELGESFFVFAHLKPGITMQEAKERLAASTVLFRAKFPGVLAQNSAFSVVPVTEFILGDMRSFLSILLGAVGLVLLIACSNVASLLLARATGRRHEIGIRVAIGASRARVIRQLLTESVLLFLAAGGCGLTLGYAGIRVALASTNTDFQRIGDKGTAVVLDWRVLVFVLSVSLITGIIFGLLPAVTASRGDLNSILKSSSGRTGTGLRQNRVRAVLVGGEVALAVILLIASALLTRSFVALYKVDRGFDAKNVVTMKAQVVGPRYETAASVSQTIRGGLTRIRAIPGVAAASATCCVPLQGQNTMSFEIVGRAQAANIYSQWAGWTTVWPGFFDVFRIRIKQGRDFDDHDTASAPGVVIINETMARLYWKNRNPIGERIVLNRRVMKELKDDPVRQIVGVAGDVRDSGLADEPRPVMYVPQEQLPAAANVLVDEPLAWVVRTQSDPHRLAPLIEAELRKATGLPVADRKLMDEVVSLSLTRQQFTAVIMGVFGGVALLLAAIGIYGLMAYTVQQRTQEIGIRLALGAEARQVRGMVIRQGMILALIGTICGLGAAWVLARVLEGLLYGVKARDPLVFVAAPLILGAIALLAVWIPAARAVRVNPVEALRYE